MTVHIQAQIFPSRNFTGIKVLLNFNLKKKSERLYIFPYLGHFYRVLFPRAEVMFNLYLENTSFSSESLSVRLHEILKDFKSITADTA